MRVVVSQVEKRILFCSAKRSVSAASAALLQRVSEFPGEHLRVSLGKLFCNACRETLSLKRSVVQLHVRSKKHEASKENLRNKTSRERDIALALQAHDAQTHRKGESLPANHSLSSTGGK